MIAQLPEACRRNIGGFLAFRVLFNARFYYPVFMILFLDFGLSVDQFSWLNAVWAVAIVTLEVPSGALADLVGRRNLVIAAAVFMIAEMLVLILLPLDVSVGWLLAAFIANRILSGAAEAAASGADEALAYDTLVRSQAEDRWPRVLEQLGKMMSVAMFTAMMIGALSYDPKIWNGVLNLLGVDFVMTKEETLKLPLIACLATGIGALIAACQMQELKSEQREPCSTKDVCKAAATAFRGAFATGLWIFRHRAVWLIILGGMLLDHLARFGATITSEYLRLTHYPEFMLGPIGASFALVGLPLAVLARKLIEERTPRDNLLLLIGITLIGLVGQALALPYASLIFVYLLFGIMSLTQPMLSTYLNHFAPPAQRATVLSFKGLALNVAYGSFGILFAQIFRAAKDKGETQDAAFLDSLWVLPVYFILVSLCYLILAAWRHPGDFANSQLKGALDPKSNE